MKATLSSVLCALLTLLTLTSQAATYYQSAPSYNSAFQALVNRAVAGDIIILRAGNHYVTEPIRLPVGKNGLTIRGENGAVVRKQAHSYNAAAFEVSGNNNTLDLIDLDGGNLPEAGIIIYGQRNTVSNSKVHNCGNATAVGGGILLHNSGSPVCAFNTVIGCKVYYNYMVGISQSGHSDGVIRDNQLYENGAEGLTVDNRSHNNYIYNNWIHLNNTGNRGVGGVGIDESNGNRLDNNTVDYTRFRSGITFQNNIGGCDGTIVSNNRCNNNEGYGILERWTLYRNTNTSFQNNTLLNNRQGTQTIIYADARTASRVAAAIAGPEEISAPVELVVYPNPARESVTFEFDAATEPVSLSIANLQGQLVYQQVLRGAKSLRLATPGLLRSGAYVVTLRGPHAVTTKKLVITQ